MSNVSRREYLFAIKSRYLEAIKQEKKQILDEFCNACGYHRKYAISLLNRKSFLSNYELKKKGPKKKYNNPEILKILTCLWKATNLPCSKRLKAIIPIWLPHYPYYINKKVETALLNISSSTIDRLMAKSRSKYSKRGLSTTKPGSILKKHIPIKTNQWDERRPGFLEADTVAHCGTSVAGMFVYSLNCVDIATGWTQQRAVWGKGEQGVSGAIVNIERSLPFQISGFDCDNGSEFLNWHLNRYLSDRKKSIEFTRSRAYHKNDNAHVEGKNWTHIRQYLGYDRFEDKSLVDLLNNLYKNEWNLYFNYFIPSMKLIEKKRVGSKIVKKYDKPKTPCQRLLESKLIDRQTKMQLRRIFIKLDPIKLQKRMAMKIKNIMGIVYQTKVEEQVNV